MDSQRRRRSADNTQEPPHTGTLGRLARRLRHATTDTLSQTVTLPSGCSSYQLSFWLHIDTAETTHDQAYDTLNVQVLNSSGTVLGDPGHLLQPQPVTGYAQHTYNLSALRRADHHAEVHRQPRTPTTQTSFVIDDTAINVS